MLELVLISNSLEHLRHVRPQTVHAAPTAHVPMFQQRPVRIHWCPPYHSRVSKYLAKAAVYQGIFAHT